MTFQHILFSIEDGVALLSLNRPEQLNSFNTAMHLEVREALKQVRQSGQARVLLLTGEGRGFCAGQDLSDRNVAPGAEMPDLGESIERFYNPLVRTLRELLDEQELGLGEVGFALRLRRDPALREAVDGWLDAEPRKPDEVPAGDWLRWEQDKHSRLLAAARTLQATR